MFEWILIITFVNPGLAAPEIEDWQMHRNLNETQCVAILDEMVPIKERFGAVCIGFDGTIISLDDR